jgi:hypothetical protein
VRLHALHVSSQKNWDVEQNCSGFLALPTAYMESSREFLVVASSKAKILEGAHWYTHLAEKITICSNDDYWEFVVVGHLLLWTS